MYFLDFYAIRHKSSNLYPTYLKGYEATEVSETYHLMTNNTHRGS